MKIGKPLEVLIRREGYDYRIISKIEDVSKDRVCITLIASGKHIFQFLDTDEIDIVYRNNDRMWKWTKVSGDIAELEGEKFHCLRSSNNGVSYNRRDAYRVNLNEKIKLKHKMVEKHSDSESGSSYYNETCDAIIRDVSEVGVGFYSDELLLLEEIVAFDFHSFIGVITCKAVVVRFFESRHGSCRYYYGCRIIETNKYLTKYIYEMQRRELQKLKDRGDRR